MSTPTSSHPPRFPDAERAGALAGLRVLEFAGLGAAPFAATMLADAGAEVIRIDRTPTAPASPLTRGRAHLQLNLKLDSDTAVALELITRADVLIEAFRPGAMERLGLGPDEARSRNPRLIYARMTGWGQDGPRARQAGHDINYLALSGALRSIARHGQAPVPPLNLVGDYGSGLLLAFGITAALNARTIDGKGQVLDVAMIDGVSSLMTGIWTRRSQGRWTDVPGTNDIDTGAPFYNVYATCDGEYMAVGSYEAQFWDRLLDTLDLDRSRPELQDQWDRAAWPAAKILVATAFARETRDHWTTAFAAVDACVTPVLSLSEAATDPHILARKTLVNTPRGPEPAPAPRLLRTPSRPRGANSLQQALLNWGLDSTAQTPPDEGLPCHEH